MIHEIRRGLYDREFVVQYTNGGELVNLDAAHDEFGMFVRTEVPRKKPATTRRTSCGGTGTNTGAVARRGADPFLLGEFSSGRHAGQAGVPAAAGPGQDYTPEWRRDHRHPGRDDPPPGARDGRHGARPAIELPIAWTDAWGNEHDTVTGNPGRLPRDARPGGALQRLPDHPRAGILMSLLGTIDRPGGFRHKAPFPRPIRRARARRLRPARGAAQPAARRDGARLAVRPRRPVRQRRRLAGRIDKAFSWEYPLSVHGLMHNVVTNAWRGDPYPIDTLLIFMANMSWNSTMNTAEVRDAGTTRASDGEYKIPFLVVADAFHSEMTAFADLILPDTTYLERHDVMSMLDRPISEFDGPVDAVRILVLPVDRRLQNRSRKC